MPESSALVRWPATWTVNLPKSWKRISPMETVLVLKPNLPPTRALRLSLGWLPERGAVLLPWIGLAVACGCDEDVRREVEVSPALTSLGQTPRALGTLPVPPTGQLDRAWDHSKLIVPEYYLTNTLA